MTSKMNTKLALTAIFVIACGLDWRMQTVSAQDQSAYLLLIDEDTIDNDQAPNQFPIADVNGTIAQVGLRDPLPAFLSKETYHMTLRTGQPGDEGWFALRSTPPTWISEDGSVDGLRNFLLAGPGLGSPDANGSRSALLTSVSDVSPLGNGGLTALVGSLVCAVVFDRDVQIGADTLAADLSGANLGLIAFRVIGVSPDQSTLSLPDVEIEILDVNLVCGGSLSAFQQAP